MTSPWETLGLEPGAQKRDIKRAYAALIKVHRPDDSPEEFQRIHQAYKAALSGGPADSRVGKYQEPAAEPVHDLMDPKPSTAEEPPELLRIFAQIDEALNSVSTASKPETWRFLDSVKNSFDLRLYRDSGNYFVKAVCREYLGHKISSEAMEVIDSSLGLLSRIEDLESVYEQETVAYALHRLPGYRAFAKQRKAEWRKTAQPSMFAPRSARYAAFAMDCVAVVLIAAILSNRISSMSFWPTACCTWLIWVCVPQISALRMSIGQLFTSQIVTSDHGRLPPIRSRVMRQLCLLAYGLPFATLFHPNVTAKNSGTYLTAYAFALLISRYFTYNPIFLHDRLSKTAVMVRPGREEPYAS